MAQIKRILVTGGAGFIGCNFVRQVLEQTQAQVLVFDKLTYAGSLENLRSVEDNTRYGFFKGDIAERADVEKAFGDFKPDAVVNFAAESHVDRSIDGPAEFVRTNIAGTFVLLDAARAMVATLNDRDKETFRFLHVSTDEVYGSLGVEGLFTEDTAYAPNSPYSASKASADHLVRAYFHTYKLPVLITNCSNNYGPFQFPEKLIPLMLLNALDAKTLPVYGDGSNIRDWLHVADHCSGILLALQKGKPGSKYNIGGRNERSNLDLVKQLCAALDEARPPAENPAMKAKGLNSYFDLVEFVRDRPGHDARYAIDADKIRRELGWKPEYDFESGLRQTVAWYLENHDWATKVGEDKNARERIGLGKD